MRTQEQVKYAFPQGTVKALNSSGHAVIEFDLESGEKVAEAQEAIDTYGSKAVFDPATKDRIRDPKLGTHEEYLVVPPMAGGR